MIEESEDRLGMTDEQWATFKRVTSGYGDQDANGVDLSLLRENLKLTPDQRLKKHHEALLMVLEVQCAASKAGIRKTDSGAR